MRRRSALNQESGLIAVILIMGLALTLFSGSHVDGLTGQSVNNFFNSATLIQFMTDTSFIAVMAVGMSVVIISGGIDLSVGSIYAFSGVAAAMLLRAISRTETLNGVELFAIALAACLSIGLICGWLNGFLITRLKVHPFVITLGGMWIYRGIAFVASKAESILVPHSVTGVVKANLGLRSDLFPVPMLVMILATIVGSIYLFRTVSGRRVFAVGGNAEASRFAGLDISRILTSVYVISGLCAGLAAFLGSGFYGSASCSDGQGYELFVIASAVIGGASLKGGKGSALGGLLGAVVVVLIRQAIRTMKWDQNYEQIIVGIAIIVAVVLDRWGRRLAESRLSA